MSSQNGILSNILFLFIFRFSLLLSGYNSILYEFQLKKEKKFKYNSILYEFQLKKEKNKFFFNLNTLIVKSEIKVLLALFVTNVIQTSLLFNLWVTLFWEKFNCKSKAKRKLLTIFQIIKTTQGYNLAFITFFLILFYFHTNVTQW
jgi:hypothetical protein